ncbi:ExbD/TolR family protein [Beijerinckia mobilis]|uniref:ExbD/TolR family protein n=1 Tax=Beijerinckia mobilis TaxID=231434 RepID=UPI000550FBD2|nr:biopolymer transporter ExbD [Beijerinckia mobilis]
MDEKPFETMNVIPFVDIMLVMLAIVLTTASFITTGRLPVNLPQAARMPAERHTDRIIELTAGGETAFDGKATSKEELAATLADLAPDTSFLIRADKSIPLQQFIDVADLLKQAHFSKVAVQTQASR